MRTLWEQVFNKSLKRLYVVALLCRNRNDFFKVILRRQILKIRQKPPLILGAINLVYAQNYRGLHLLKFL